MDKIDIAGGLLWYLAFLVSTTFHEAAHAFVAWRGGDPTAYEGGQVSLSPLPHIRREPIGMVAVPLLTALTQGWALGWASTPYSPFWAERYPRRAALMGAAGPAANILIAVLAFVLLKVGIGAGVFVSPPSVQFDHLVDAVGGGPAAALLVKTLSIFLMLNVLLGAFNLLPVPPLDGSSALGLILPAEMMDSFRNFARGPGFSLVGLLIAWQVFPYIARPLFGLVLALLHPASSYH